MSAIKRQAPIDVTLPSYGVYLLESHHAPSFRMGEQSHSFLELFFVHSGSGAFRIDSREHPCQRNDVVVVPPRLTHAIADNPDDPLTLYAACVAAAVVRHEPALFERLPVGRVRISKSLAEQTRAAFRRLLFEQTQPGPFSPTLIVGLTLELLASIARGTAIERRTSGHVSADTPAKERRAAVERYVARLAHRFFERASLDEAAAELGMSRRRFTTLFSDVTGRTWADYVTQLRVEYAQTLLRTTPRSIVSIAFECGYEELSSFYRAFKKSTGKSPGDWRVQHRDGSATVD